MSINTFSQIRWIRMLLAIVYLFSVSKLSYQAPTVENIPNEHSTELFHKSDKYNQASEKSSWLSVQNKTSSTAGPQTEDIPFSWKDILRKAEEFESTYCSIKCHGTVLVYPHGRDLFSRKPCFPCDCNKPLCEFYRTCCPNYNMTSADSDSVFVNEPNTTQTTWLNSSGDERDMRVSKDTSTDLVCSGDGSMDYLSKRSCPLDYPDGEVKSKCQKDIPTAEQDIDTFLHVTDKITGVTYYNEYCAACNNVSEYQPWTLSVKCRNYKTVYSSRTPGELLRLSLDPFSYCKTLPKPPDRHESYICDRNFFSGTVVEACNVTGQWEVYNANVVKACADTSGLVHRVRVCAVGNPDYILYRNLYCAVCNTNGHPMFDLHCGKHHLILPPTGGMPDIRLPFSVLLNFGSQGRLSSRISDVSNCSQHSDWTSPDKKCFPLQCSPGKILTNGSCSTVFSQIRGLVYQFRVYYVPTVITEMPENLKREYLLAFEKYISRIALVSMKKLEITLTLVFSEKTDPSRDNQTSERVNKSQLFQLDWFLVDGFMQGHRTYSRDDLETSIVMDLILNNLTVDIDANTTVTLMPMLYPHRKQTLMKCNEKETGISTCISSTFTSRHVHHVSERDQQTALIIESHLSCAFVQFDKWDYLYMKDTETKPHRFSITLYFKNTRMVFSDIAELNMVSIDDNGTLRICHDLLKNKTLISSEFINNDLLKLSLYILTLICVISSIICLAITLLTYFLFPVLRSLAGKNNIFLCGSLLLAQISLLATSHVQENGHLCTILAICTHFLWLSMFCWCFTCCFHMFCVFSAKTRSIQSSAKSEMTYMIKRVVACSVIPGVIVTGVIATNLTISGGKFFGYGNTTCFVDSQIFLIITLVAPLCLVLVFNFIFFSVTVIKIYQVRKLQTREFRKDDHNNLYIYIKLSSMTGIFWVLSVISEATDNDPLRFISIGLNGLQGVFIFLSYICNRRVLMLYLRLLGLETYFPTTSTSDRSTMAKVVADVDKQAHRSDDTDTVE